MIDPRHIEVQILADNAGNVIHLYERDCTVQRRHQKVVEIAPAPNLDPSCGRRCAPTRWRSPGTSATAAPAPWSSWWTRRRSRLHRDESADPGGAHRDRGDHRRRPGASQLRIASGETLADLGLTQEDDPLPGAALQCRITTEDPANGFRPDTGRISAYRTPGGAGVRLDGSTDLGAEISAALRLDAGQADLPGPGLPRGGRAGAPGDRGVPDSRASRPICRSCKRSWTTRTSRPAGSPRRSSTNVPSC